MSEMNRAEQLRKEGLARVREHRLEDAIALYDEAIAIAGDEESRELITINKADALITLERTGPEVNDLARVIMRRRKPRHVCLAAYALQYKHRIEQDLKRALFYGQLALRAAEKGLELACHIHPDVPDEVLGDVGQLRQVLLNVLGNAVKFTDAGEVVLDVNVEEVTAARATLRFAVMDTGVGIPADKQQQIARLPSVDSLADCLGLARERNRNHNLRTIASDDLRNQGRGDRMAVAGSDIDDMDTRAANRKPLPSQRARQREIARADAPTG